MLTILHHATPATKKRAICWSCTSWLNSKPPNATIIIVPAARMTGPCGSEAMWIQKVEGDVGERSGRAEWVVR
jgi:hypothetical protein